MDSTIDEWWEEKTKAEREQRQLQKINANGVNNEDRN
jgi:hypothetical protein